jgi:hypothetical protein
LKALLSSVRRFSRAAIAAQTPPLADGLKALDVMKQTLDTILGGAKAYGLRSPGNFPADSSDTPPSLLIAAEECAKGGNSDLWLAVVGKNSIPSENAGLPRYFPESSRSTP